MKRLGAILIGAVALALLVQSDSAQAELGTATTTAACCTLTTSLVNEAIRGNDVVADERFFMTEGAPPNIHFLIDNSGSMNELPQVRSSREWVLFNDGEGVADPNYEGCMNSRLLDYETARSWDGSTVYPQADPGTGLGSDTGFPNLFQSSKFYNYGWWGRNVDFGYTTGGGDHDNPPPRSETTAADVCTNLLPDTFPDYANRRAICQRCLNERGFYKVPGVTYDESSLTNWRYSTSRFVFTGNFLNFNPPKYVLLRRVLKTVIADLRRVRAGYSTFSSSGWGGDLRQKQNPSCKQIAKDGSAFDNNRASYINDINAITFNTSTPLAETLLNIGQFFSTNNSIYKNKFGFADSYLKNSYSNGSLTSEGRSWCWGCQISSVIIITDGEPTEDNQLPRNKIYALNGGQVRCPDYDGDGTGDCYWKEDNGSGGDNDLLDDVAKMLANQDLQQSSPVVVGDMNSAGRQSMSIYAIGLGVKSAILRSASEGVGNGEYHEASDAASLKQEILDIIQTVQTRATAFAAASVASLQVNKTGGSVLPRFKPSRQGSKGPWQGFLYRFDLAYERVLGCDPVQARTLLSGGAGDPNDINRDGDCEDVNLMDKDPLTGGPKDAVLEDDQGNFVKLNNPLVPANPFWEASAKLNTSSAYDWKPVDQGGRRRIYTIIDNGMHSGSGCTAGADNKIDSCDKPIEFRAANAGVLREYMGISQNPAECGQLATLLGLLSLTPDDCTKLIINYYRGADVLNPDPAKRDQDQPYLLRDVFHSAPIVVEPLAEKIMCGTNQCVQTLFKGKTPLNPSALPDAYDQAVSLYGNRDKIVLVGSNGGMLHAFHYGKATGVDPVTGMANYDAGTGDELWAFIPPDLLPKLRTSMGKHAYFVDGTAMVRDAWIDGAGGDPKDGQKEQHEFRTVAVVGEGEGGVHRFALDLTRLIGTGGPANHNVPDQRGDFLWMWPQTCDQDGLDLEVGESSGTFAPRAPPIGAVAMADPNGPWKIDGVQAREQWVAFFNGGNDRYQLRGRGMAIVDLATGKTLWKFFQDDGSPNSGELRYSFYAPAAMIDMGNADSSRPDRDLLFDTATIGDMGGQIWTARFWRPGVVDGSGEVTNWFAGRSFQISANNDNTARVPISQMTSNAVQPDTGYLRTFVGSGDRNSLMDTPGPACRLSTPYGCARQGCNVDYHLTVSRGGGDTRRSHEHFDDYEIREADATRTTAGPACASADVKLEWKIDKKNACGVDPADGNLEWKCSGDLGTWSCGKVHDDWAIFSAAGSPPVATNGRFYGFWSYGVNPNRKFNDGTGATAYDDARLHDTNLVDVTGATISAAGASSVEAGPLANGWVIHYNGTDERTGSGSTIVNGCVLWNSFEPSGGSAVCSTAGTNTARFYQGGFVSGAPNCAASFYDPATGTWARSISRDVVAVPGEPAVQRTVYNGQGGTTVITLEAGNTGSNTVSTNQDLVQSMYSIEVNRAAHDCRHEGANCK